MQTLGNVKGDDTTLTHSPSLHHVRSHNPRATMQIPSPPLYPYTFHRIYLCGHPPELIKVTRPPPLYQDHSPCSQNDLTFASSLDPNICAATSTRSTNLVYTLERCKQCVVTLRGNGKRERRGLFEAVLRNREAHSLRRVYVDETVMLGNLVDNLAITLRHDAHRHAPILPSRFSPWSSIASRSESFGSRSSCGFGFEVDSRFRLGRRKKTWVVSKRWLKGLVGERCGEGCESRELSNE